MYKLKTFLQTKPVYLFLLPVFFVLHGFTAHYDLVPAKESLLLVLKYNGVSVFLVLLFWVVFKNFSKAGLAAFVVMAYNLFFGTLHDFFKNIFGDSVIVKYSFIFAVSIILLTTFVILLKKNKKNLTGIIKYLNWLFLLLILFDTGALLLKATRKREPIVVNLPKELTSCDTCSKPDIYLIVADEYANAKQLKETFNFDNSKFENDLKRRGFYIIQNSKSNYNSTVFSIASMLSMNYIDSLGKTSDNRSVTAGYRQINENVVTKWLRQQDYEMKNHSIFHFDNIPTTVNSIFFLKGTGLFTSQTLAGRFNRDIRFNFITRFKIKSEIKKFVQDRMNNNSTTLIDKTIKEANSPSNKPRFIYLHTIMPHFPYLMDSSGTPDYKTSFTESNRFNKTSYLGYLQYSNKIFLQLIDIIQSASSNAIIIFMGDHGFRQMEGNYEGHFMSFNSIYLPQKNYSQFYDGMSMVNEFRTLFNTQFNQHLPILKDSTIFRPH